MAEVRPLRPDPPAGAAERELVRRVAASRRFAKSGRLRDLLLFITERALDEPNEQLRERDIGCSVFGRPAEYDTSADNVVRVSASMLRKRLEEYFAAEGRDEPMVIRLPRGSYLPIFERRVDREPEHDEDLDMDLPARPPRLRPITLTAAALLILLCGVAVTWWLASRRSAGPILSGSGSNSRALSAFWSSALDNQADAVVVLADSSFALLQDFLHRPFSLTDYMDRNYLTKLNAPGTKTPPIPELELLAYARHTGITYVNVAQRILAMHAGGKRKVVPRFARDMQAADFRTSNIVLVGSHRPNPWVELFEAQMNFRFEFDDNIRQSRIRNVSPQPGEEAVYVTNSFGKPAIRSAEEEFGVVALLPNLNRSGNVVLAFGMTAEGSEAAGEFITNDAACAQLLARLGVGDQGPVRPFEALFRVTRVGGSFKNATLIAHRLK